MASVPGGVDAINNYLAAMGPALAEEVAAGKAVDVTIAASGENGKNVSFQLTRGKDFFVSLEEKDGKN